MRKKEDIKNYIEELRCDYKELTTAHFRTSIAICINRIIIELNSMEKALTSVNDEFTLLSIGLELENIKKSIICITRDMQKK